MKTISVFLVFLLVMGCSKPSSTETANNKTSADSIRTDSTGTTEAEEIAEESESEETGEEGENEEGDYDVELYFDEKSHLILNEQESFYEANVSANGYESSSDQSWYFDMNFNIKCYKQSWALEGQEGESEFYLEDDIVVCAMEKESGGMETTTTRACREGGGKKTIENEGGEAVNEAVPESYLDTKKKEVDDQIASLRELLRGEEIADPDAETYTFTIENKVDVGQEVTETTTITIPKKLYEKLMNP